MKVQADSLGGMAVATVLALAALWFGGAAVTGLASRPISGAGSFQTIENHTFTAVSRAAFVAGDASNALRFAPQQPAGSEVERHEIAVTR